MPIYAFECDACGHDFDRLQKLADPDPAACPECGAGAVRRRLTAPAFRLAGSGWYETDFKKDGKRNLAEKGDGKAADKGDGKAADKGEGAAKGSAGSTAGGEAAAAPAAAAKPDTKPAATPKVN